MMRNEIKLPPIHPGEILNEDFLIPMGISKYRLAKAIGVDATRIHSIVLGTRAITAETALLLARYFGNSAEFWMGLQAQYERERAQDEMAERLAAIIPRRARTAT
jgi:addiction module HigA family antidote